MGSDPKKSQKINRPKNTVDPGFAAELEKIKLKKEAEEKEKADKIRKNKELFEQRLKSPATSKSKSKRPSTDNNFLEEIKRLEAEKEKEEKKLTPAERLAKLKEEMDRKRLESISSGKSELDKTDMKLLFSQKW